MKKNYIFTKYSDFLKEIALIKALRLPSKDVERKIKISFNSNVEKKHSLEIFQQYLTESPNGVEVEIITSLVHSVPKLEPEPKPKQSRKIKR